MKSFAFLAIRTACSANQIAARIVPACAIALLSVEPARATTFLEVEPNESKTTATPALSMVDGDSLAGFTEGSSTTTPGEFSADYFRVQLAPRPAGIYRHRLRVEDISFGFLRGLNQTNGVVGTLDVIAQQSVSFSSDSTNQWYGFGRGETLYYRIHGIHKLTGNYVGILMTVPVTPIEAPGAFVPGSITITTIGQGHSTDTDFWVYDQNFNALPGYGNNDESIAGGGSGITTQSLLTRDYAQGTYYVAISDLNVANNLASPPDDDSRNGVVLDFPDAVMNSSSAFNVNLTMSISDGAQSVTVPVVKSERLQIVWVKFVVGCTCTGDLNGDSAVSILDVPLFAESLLNAAVDVCADMNHDSADNGLDIGAFVDAVIDGACP